MSPPSLAPSPPTGHAARCPEAMVSQTTRSGQPCSRGFSADVDRDPGRVAELGDPEPVPAGQADPERDPTLEVPGEAHLTQDRGARGQGGAGRDRRGAARVM